MGKGKSFSLELQKLIVKAVEDRRSFWSIQSLKIRSSTCYSTLQRTQKRQNWKKPRKTDQNWPTSKKSPHSVVETRSKKNSCWLIERIKVFWSCKLRSWYHQKMPTSITTVWSTSSEEADDFWEEPHSQKKVCRGAFELDKRSVG